MLSIDMQNDRDVGQIYRLLSTAGQSRQHGSGSGFEPRKRRMSLPPLERLLMQEQERRRQAADEEAERQEYDHKAQLVSVYHIWRVLGY